MSRLLLSVIPAMVEFVFSNLPVLLPLLRLLAYEQEIFDKFGDHSKLYTLLSAKFLNF